MMNLVYHVPQPFKCDQCNHVEMHSPDHPRTAPVFVNDETGAHEPICTKCYEVLLRTYCGVLKPIR